MNANDRSIVGLVMVGHGMVHTYELAIPILMVVWLVEFQVSAALLGAVVTVGFAMFGLGAIPAGMLSDAIGSRRVIVGCLLGMGISFVLLALTPLVPAVPPMATITFALLCWGVAASVYHPAGLSLISTGVQERGTAFAYHGMAGNAGIALGPLIAAVLLFLIGDWQIVAGLLSVPSFLGAAYALGIDVDERAAVVTDGGGPADDSRGADRTGSTSDELGDGEGSGDATSDRAGGSAGPTIDTFGEFVTSTRLLFSTSFAVIFLLVIMSGLYYRGVLTFLPAIVEDLALFEPMTIGAREFEPAQFVYSGILLVGMLGQYIGGRLTDRIRVERGLAGAFLVLAILGLVYIPAAGAGTVTFLVASAVLGVALFVVQPMYQAAVAEYTPSGSRGLSYGYTYLGVFGVGALGGAIAGGLLTYASVAGLFVTLSAFAVLAVALALVLWRLPRPAAVRPR